ncbi:AmmeMemoRadiSam system protein B [bacterium]|nr:AmmeMemoRadiSam system protein B [bacterium]
MSELEYPKLRYVEAFPVETNNGPLFGLRDPSGVAPETLVISPDIFYLLQYFDGRHSQGDLRAKYHGTFGDSMQDHQFEEILNDLNKHLFLENRHFQEKLRSIEEQFRSAPSRPAVHAGKSYEADPVKLRAQIDAFFNSPDGAGRPDGRRKRKPISGLIAPHIDVRAGGACYSHAYRALAESAGADCFVILGTGHSGLDNLYSTLPKDFETPLGLAKCDTAFIERLKSNYGGDLDSNILAHKSEHVIEFQLVFLQHLFEELREFTFVPILCSFSYHMLNGSRFPHESKIIDEFTSALKRTLTSFGEKVCLIASVDLSHVGQLYGDPRTPDEAFLSKVKQVDAELLSQVQKLDAEGFHRCIERHEDRYRMCGFSSIYTLLKAIDANECRLLNYASTEVDSNHSTVTFASLSFH